ncbi:hypothetical protein SLEP1_g33080 [Rubroshorea leprosula]|uniref:Cytochrome P450 n=1 Tax=Rubroshorea leprosula TaxID=152421 RepID=A0AAV5KFH1_9ROSI|nr:hypothetical protein SLEP1_g33080 [Rubroshorea leprosula]
MKRTLRQIIESRLQKSRTTTDSSPRCCFGDDLLSLMIAASETNQLKVDLKLNMNEIIEECKTFFFAGHETTSSLLSWAMFLMSKHQEWQAKLREEVLKECGKGTPNANMLAKLKLVNMALLEVLRLYGPVVALKQRIYWGKDASEFNPLRFKNGISKAAKHPNALLAFLIGPRACSGQSFATSEAKTVLALILQRFSFSFSPDYKHAPANHITLQPRHGLLIVIKPLNM